jgi:hypothetical protein
MKLTIKDRFFIQAIYPKESSLIEQLLVKSIKEKCIIKAEEAEKIGLRSVDNTMVWDKSKEYDIDVEFTPAELTLLKTQIDVLDKAKKITLNLVDLCVKIKETK